MAVLFFKDDAPISTPVEELVEIIKIVDVSELGTVVTFEPTRMRSDNQRVAKETRISYPYREMVIVFPVRVVISIVQEIVRVVLELEAVIVESAIG